MTRLHDLYEQQGQSPWLDNLRRDFLTGGTLKRLLDEGIRGITSNPTIFAKAIESEPDYDKQFAELLATKTVEECYWELVITDITDALAMLAGLHESSGGVDGFVSLEVAPALAHDTRGTIESARKLHERIDRPNLFVKIPATEEGVAAIRTMIAEGRNINVTLLFSLERYSDVVEAYIGGLEDFSAQGATDLSRVASVASFFVSRVDTEIDRRLEKLTTETSDPELAAKLRASEGSAAVAQAREAYKIFTERFRGPRWEALAKKGAKVQRLLWASTSTKNPAYPDLLYVDQLIGPETVNTMPDQTIDAFLDHGTVARTVDAVPDQSRQTLDNLAGLGIDLAGVARVLEDEGVASFAKSFDELIEALESKARSLTAGDGRG
ncbi:MAG: transaldolase [Acidimicrobiales bacterium]